MFKISKMFEISSLIENAHAQNLAAAPLINQDKEIQSAFYCNFFRILGALLLPFNENVIHI